MRTLIASIVAVPLVFTGLSGFAQNSLSADQIINSLKPTGNVVGQPSRGIRLVTPQPGATAVPITQAATGQPHAGTQAARSAEIVAPSANLTVNFASGSAELTPQAVRQLDELGRALSSSALSGYKFRIEGHTDTVGTPESNRALSEYRAKAVATYITAKFNIDPARLVAVGKGEDELAVRTPAQTAEPRNRRVQIINLGA